MNIGKKSLTFIALAVAAFATAFLLIPDFFNTPHPVEKPAALVGPILVSEAEIHAKYSGSETCRECHQAAVEKWLHSHHGLAERAVGKDKDYPFFSPKQTFGHSQETSEAFVDADGLAKILTLGLDKKQHSFPVVRVIGHDPLRQFLIAAPGGRMQACDAALDPTKNEWFGVFGDDERVPGDWGHWTGQGMNWNSMCAACHNTRVRKNYEPRANSYHTTMAEMTVSCEACHGPMKDHVVWQKKPLLGAKKDPTLHPFSRDQVTETCAACHARRGELTGDLIPGEKFDDHFSLTVADETNTFYPDGQIHSENYEYSSFLSSKMHHAGVRCADCHDPHSNELLTPGNQLCMNCHAGTRKDFPSAPVINPVTHSHHGSDSTGNQCVSCHMPVTTYMQRDPRHDHGFTIPDPRLTKEETVPNACNRCHSDKDADWAISAMKQFYGEKPDRSTRTRALLVAQARRGEHAARDGLVRLLASEPIPAWQATACRLLAHWGLEPPVIQAMLGQITNTSPLVREAAARTLEIPAREKNNPVRDALQPLLDDSSRSVRIAAAWALCDTLDLETRAGRELVHMLDLNADQPTGRMQLGQFASLRGDQASAIRQMRKAIEWDPNSAPFHHDLAILLNTTGDSNGSIQEFRRAIRLDPGSPEYYFTLALSLNESGDLPGTITALEETVRLDSHFARAWYNLGLARSSMNQLREAIDALRHGEVADPADAAIPYARATVHARLGQKNEALAAASRALQLRPDFLEANQLLQGLSR